MATGEPAWGWWRGLDEPLDTLRWVVADWMQQHGHPGWAGWFRQPPQRPDAFFTKEGSQRVMVGAVPVKVPPNTLAGPWFQALHVALSGGDDLPGLEEVGEVPCMAYLRELAVHADHRSHAGRSDALRLELSSAPLLASQLEGLWVQGLTLPALELEHSPRLRRLGAALGPGRWRHEGLQELYTWASDDLVELELPALRELDLECGAEVRNAGMLLRQVPTLEHLEIDDTLAQVVSQAHAAGRLPRLRTLAVWGERIALPGVSCVQRAPWSREGIRITSDWVFERALSVSA